jgi:ankyrin repeat protein
MASKRTPLYEAASGGFADICELLIKGGADPNVEVKDKNGTRHTALSIAASLGRSKCVQLLQRYVHSDTSMVERRSGSVASTGSKSRKDSSDGGGCCVMS